jgi:predicted dinucleotide-binding enzyme
MSIALLGTGNMGRALAPLLAEADIATLVAGRDRSRAASLVRDVGGPLTAATFADAAQADTLILAVPFSAAPAVLSSCGPLDGKVLIDMSNPVTADFLGLTVGFDTSAAEEIARLAPRAHVVKAFNTLFASVFSLPAERRRQVQVLIAGDEPEALERTAALVRAIGFSPVRAGGLANARFLEPVGEMNIHFGYALGWGTNIAPAWVKLAA